TTEDRSTEETNTGEWRRELYDASPERGDELTTTISGLENEPLYTPDNVDVDYERDVATRASTPLRAGSTRRCTPESSGGCASSRASGRPRRRTSASATCSSTARPDSPPRSTCRR